MADSKSKPLLGLESVAELLYAAHQTLIDNGHTKDTAMQLILRQFEEEP